ncbi:hypothetical protein DPMN_185646 [Dreissena polymorpha]|uniref:Uncharacterized protein n=1 Tax=Dreissena polymorpha TaxID=45954 RepID=A0A9D4DKX3_DREPO|nr:hypothetical protein DPMN_185646 [Dreissena polymorpha]
MKSLALIVLVVVAVDARPPKRHRFKHDILDASMKEKAELGDDNGAAIHGNEAEVWPVQISTL